MATCKLHDTVVNCSEIIKLWVAYEFFSNVFREYHDFIWKYLLHSNQHIFISFFQNNLLKTSNLTKFN